MFDSNYIMKMWKFNARIAISFSCNLPTPRHFLNLTLNESDESDESYLRYNRPGRGGGGGITMSYYLNADVFAPNRGKGG